MRSEKTSHSVGLSPNRVSPDLVDYSGEADIPRFDLATELCAVFQAVGYFNTCIYRDLSTLNDFGPHPSLYLLPLSHLHTVSRCPHYLTSIFVCTTLTHRINRIRNSSPCHALVQEFYRYRSIALRALNEDIGANRKRNGDLIIAGIINLLLSDAQIGTFSDWRMHQEGVQRIIALRGGIRALAGQKQLGPLLNCFLSISVLGNTTCPASDLTSTEQHLEELEFILKEHGSGLSPFQICPPHLFAEMIKINNLRMEGCQSEVSTELSEEASSILDQIDSFSPERWAEQKPRGHQDWELMGRIYQNAVSIYCISSCQSLRILPLSERLKDKLTRHGQVLHTLLSQAVSVAKTQRLVIWPLVVLGVQAVNGGVAQRTFAAKQLQEMSRYVGTTVPLVAKGFLEKFWASGETRWDACFDRPYAFATQIAVDNLPVLLEKSDW
ncbi:hypothetical protein B0A52_04086 [Exophiala mesophila]|uniref:Uncharacterized protein n=1 Tax=Exophiala mesophila TaxID=212818 RepID=A0A438NA94_EXOME|nr:hypothetical protein B0A52_04086 [Exophiala mesophila]